MHIDYQFALVRLFKCSFTNNFFFIFPCNYNYDRIQSSILVYINFVYINFAFIIEVYEIMFKSVNEIMILQ